MTTVPYDIIQDVLAVLNIIAGGRVPTVACDEVGLSYTTFCQYTKKYPQLAELRIEAEDRLYDQMAEALPRIFDHPIYGANEAKEASVISSNIKWLLERRRQKTYGAHSVVEHQITADKQVLDALDRAKARAHGFNQPVIEASVTDIISDDVLMPRALHRLTQQSGPVIQETDEERYQREFAEIC